MSEVTCISLLDKKDWWHCFSAFHFSFSPPAVKTPDTCGLHVKKSDKEIHGTSVYSAQTKQGKK